MLWELVILYEYCLGGWKIYFFSYYLKLFCINLSFLFGGLKLVIVSNRFIWKERVISIFRLVLYRELVLLDTGVMFRAVYVVLRCFRIVFFTWFVFLNIRI